MTEIFDIDSRKITHYLLSPNSKGKEQFFFGLGYTLISWATLRNDLLKHPFSSTFEGDRPATTKSGSRKIYRCQLPPSPNGKTSCVRTVWENRSGKWWLITAYPQS